MIVRPDADALLAGELGQWLAGQGDARAAAKAAAKRRRRWGFIGAGVIFVAVLVFSGFDLGKALWFGGAVAAGGWAWGEMAKQPVIAAIKGGINGAIARALDVDYSPEATPGEEFRRASQFQLLPGHDASRFEDLWRGTVGDRSFQLYEAHLTRREGSGKNRKTVTKFRGSVITIGFARRFHGVTLVEREQTRRNWFGLGSDKTELTFGDVTLQRCDMVDPRFEDQFTVWSNDPVEARYLVHPAYIERLVAVEQAYAGQNIRALFDGGSLVVLLETGNLFESGSIEAQDDRHLLERTITQFGALADLAAELNERARGNY
ncbi:DUF3137 domain-containing protein [Novosphingobium album (ex Liu et al. 2023)]|uniref:DUF3137 domain-containing protein n=1 Tax=Novosphingobium album (ex Liu et al. 2023) TaxID=3031130 RepID=A0ABT5WX25_9SPHN|nr:DUF3137 domain-containing protein [Novosphingobium album (ex Liu et al. 2023)]MDE8654396.1 DUF3137 domain-containing protein [Novosphingobium album (ex Liu et al. 2023)]